MRKEKGGKRGRKKMDEREKESQVEERSEVITEEGTERREEEEIQEGPAIGEAVAEEEERCEEDPECHSSAKRARVCATFTDSQEVSIVEFVKLHPELYDKEHSRFHDRTRREALWAEISEELKLQPFDVRRWFESQRTRYGKLSKLQSGQAPREMTKRQSWVYQQMGFLKTHIRRKGANRSSGFEASPNTSRQDESRGSTTDTEHLESSVLRERSQSIITSTPVLTTDSKILEHFEQMRTLISGFLHQKSEFVKLHPELYDKEHSRFHDRTKREALWAEISEELKLQPFDVRRWFESQRTRYGKLSKLQSGQAPREMTKRQSWVYQHMGFLKTHIRRKGANRSSGFEASPNTSRQDDSRGSTTDTEHLESSVLRERSQSIITSTPVSTTDSKILKHFEQMRTLISGFLHQKQTGSPSLTTWHQRPKR